MHLQGNMLLQSGGTPPSPASPAQQLLAALLPAAHVAPLVPFQEIVVSNLPPSDPLNLSVPFPYFATFHDEIRMIQMTFGPLAHPTPNHTSLLRFCYQIIEETKEKARTNPANAEKEIKSAKVWVGKLIYLADRDLPNLAGTAALLDAHRERTYTNITQAFNNKMNEERRVLDDVIEIHRKTDIHCESIVRLTKTTNALSYALITKCGVMNHPIVPLALHNLVNWDIPDGFSWVILLEAFATDRNLREAFATITVAEAPKIVLETLRIALDLPLSTQPNGSHAKQAALATLLYHIRRPEVKGWPIRDVNRYATECMLRMSYLFRKGQMDPKRMDRLGCHCFDLDWELMRKPLKLNRNGVIFYTDRHHKDASSNISFRDHPGFVAAAKVLGYKNSTDVFDEIRKRLCEGVKNPLFQTTSEIIIRMLCDMRFEAQVLMPGEKEDQLSWCFLAFCCESRNPFLPFCPLVTREGRDDATYARLCDQVNDIAKAIFFESTREQTLKETPHHKEAIRRNGENISKTGLEKGSDVQVNIFNFVFSQIVCDKVSHEKAGVFVQDANIMLLKKMTLQDYCIQLLDLANQYNHGISEFLKKQNQRLLRGYLLALGLSDEQRKSLWGHAPQVKPSLFNDEDGNYTFHNIYDPMIGDIIAVARSRDGKEVHLLSLDKYRNIFCVEQLPHKVL